MLHLVLDSARAYLTLSEILEFVSYLTQRMRALMDSDVASHLPMRSVRCSVISSSVQKAKRLRKLSDCFFSKELFFQWSRVIQRTFVKHVQLLSISLLQEML